MLDATVGTSEPRAVSTSNPASRTLFYRIEEFAQLAGVSPRRVRFYIQQRLLRSPAFRGVDTTYSPDDLLRLRAILHLRRQKLGLDAIRTRLAKLTRPELERLVAPRPTPAAEQPPGLTGQPSGAAGLPPGHLGAYRATRAFEDWQRITLCVGVELHVRRDVDDESRRVAGEIERHYGPRIIAPEATPQAHPAALPPTTAGPTSGSG
jgi:Ca-activated chloride channel family protein